MQLLSSIGEIRNRLLQTITVVVGLLFASQVYSQTDFPSGITVENGASVTGVRAADNASTLFLGGTNSGSSGQSLYGLHELTTFDPSGTPGFVFGAYFNPTLNNGVGPSTSYVGINVGLNLGSTFSGTFVNALGIESGDITFTSGSTFTAAPNFYQFIALQTVNGNGITTGTISNRNYTAGGSSAGPAAGGTIYNTAYFADLPSGSGAGTTNNTGLWIHGNGGAPGTGTTTNYAIYSDSTAPSALSGALSLARATVSTLPTCNPASKGQLYEVTDASSPSWHSTLAGGGATFSGAMCNGSNWIAF